MAAKYGDIGGKGHKLYEEWRDLDRKSEQAMKIAKESRDYYSKFY
jgi:hypothetical protein